MARGGQTIAPLIRKNEERETWRKSKKKEGGHNWYPSVVKRKGGRDVRNISAWK